MTCSFHSTSASLSEYIQYFSFISSINYEVPLTPSTLFKSCIEYKATSMAICVTLSPLCLNASHASWGCSEYRLITPDPAAHLPSLTASHTSSHFSPIFKAQFERAKPRLFRVSTAWVCFMTLVAVIPTVCCWVHRKLWHKPPAVIIGHRETHSSGNWRILYITYWHDTEATAPEKATKSFSAVLLRLANYTPVPEHMHVCTWRTRPLPKRHATEAALESTAITMMLLTARADNLLAETADTILSTTAHIWPHSHLNLI